MADYGTVHMVVYDETYLIAPNMPIEMSRTELFLFYCALCVGNHSTCLVLNKKLRNSSTSLAITISSKVSYYNN